MTRSHSSYRITVISARKEVWGEYNKTGGLNYPTLIVLKVMQGVRIKAL